MLISCAVTLRTADCTFVSQAKSMFSHNAAQIERSFTGKACIYQNPLTGEYKQTDLDMTSAVYHGHKVTYQSKQTKSFDRVH